MVGVDDARPVGQGDMMICMTGEKDDDMFHEID
jgi:hypothetical protein